MSAIYEALDILCRKCVSCTGSFDCHEFAKMREAIEKAQLEAVEDALRSIKITDIPSEEELGTTVAKGQIFIAGQIDVLFRFNNYLAKLRKAAGKGE